MIIGKNNPADVNLSQYSMNKEGTHNEPNIANRKEHDQTPDLASTNLM